MTHLARNSWTVPNQSPTGTLPLRQKVVVDIHHNLPISAATKKHIHFWKNCALLEGPAFEFLLALSLSTFSGGNCHNWEY